MDVISKIRFDQSRNKFSKCENSSVEESGGLYQLKIVNSILVYTERNYVFSGSIKERNILPL